MKSSGKLIWIGAFLVLAVIAATFLVLNRQHEIATPPAPPVETPITEEAQPQDDSPPKENDFSMCGQQIGELHQIDTTSAETALATITDGINRVQEESSAGGDDVELEEDMATEIDGSIAIYCRCLKPEDLEYFKSKKGQTDLDANMRKAAAAVLDICTKS